RVFAMQNLSKIEDSLARTLVWTAAWDATRDAEAPASDFVQLVLDHIATETESTTILTLLRQLVTTGNLYVAPQNREATLEKIASGLIALTESAAPGSDTQLQFAKFVPQFARTASQLDWLAELYEGRKSIPGLALDADLRWELLTGLVIGGRVDEAGIEAELKRDNTANGQKFAAAARAVIPNSAAKQKSWDILTKTEEYSNTLVNAASMAFGRTNDLSLLEPYVDAYHEVAPKIWESRSYHIAAYLLNNLYPIQLASEELAKQTRDLMNAEFAKSRPAFRRILLESLAGVERALKAQKADI
ncbi:MAG: ERAP1-like C-terminal domain-containing protein, partial [Aquiluna sp.]|nr:ERAP1-like C-terminal domain-containing protein [Aquiluna sp.]